MRILYEHELYTDVSFICIDGQLVHAHKFILATQSEMFRRQLYRKGDNLQENSTTGKQYEFSANSGVFRAVIEFFYRGRIKRLEDGLDTPLPFLTDLLKLARSHKFEAVEAYVRGRLRNEPATSCTDAARRFSFALDHDYLDVAEAMRQQLLILPFEPDAFKQLSEQALETILETCPLPVAELDICLAVKEWQRNYFMDDDEEIPPNILRYINLNCVSSDDLSSTIERLGIFPARMIQDAYRVQALQGTSATVVNRDRQSRALSTVLSAGLPYEDADDDADSNTATDGRCY